MSTPSGRPFTGHFPYTMSFQAARHISTFGKVYLDNRSEAEDLLSNLVAALGGIYIPPGGKIPAELLPEPGLVPLQFEEQQPDTTGWSMTAPPPLLRFTQEMVPHPCYPNQDRRKYVPD